MPNKTTNLNFQVYNKVDASSITFETFWYNLCLAKIDSTTDLSALEIIDEKLGKYRLLYGEAAPTTSTTGNKGQLYIETTTPTLYQYNGSSWVGLLSNYRTASAQDVIDATKATKTELQTEATTRQTADTALETRIENLESRGRFLSSWDCSTGLPGDYPTVPTGAEYPYTYSYKAGDYYIISLVSTTNYKPSGTGITKESAEATSWTVPKEAESNEVQANDYYIYTSQGWRLIKNTQKTVTFANIAGQPSDNTNLNTALNAKQAKLTAGTGIEITEDNVINNTQTSAEWGNITGTLSDQSDLQSALNAKQDKLVGTIAGQALIYDGSNWSKQNGYGYISESSTTVAWDGTTTGREYVSIGQDNPLAYKVSTNTPSVNDLIGGNWTYYDEEGTSTGTMTSSNTMTTNDLVVSIGGTITSGDGSKLIWVNTDDSSLRALIALVAQTLTMSIDSISVTYIVPNPGIYFYIGNSNNHTSSLTYGTSTVHKIDSKYIPSDTTKQDKLTVNESGTTATLTSLKVDGVNYNIASGIASAIIDVIALPTTGIQTNIIYRLTTDNSYHIYNGSSWLEVQEKLVSATNIKTINNQSILGSGNIEIQGGSGDAIIDVSALPTEDIKTKCIYRLTTDNTYHIYYNSEWFKVQRSTTAWGSGSPTGSTAGVVGELYIDTTTPALYQCTQVDNSQLSVEGAQLPISLSTTWTNISSEGVEKILFGTEAPTTSTQAVKGQLYINTSDCKMYHCTAVNTVVESVIYTYTWEEIKGIEVIANPTITGSEANLTSIQIGDTKYKVSGLPTGTAAGQALVYDGTGWTKQAGYGYTTGEAKTITWDGSTEGREVLWDMYCLVSTSVLSDVQEYKDSTATISELGTITLDLIEAEGEIDNLYGLYTSQSTDVPVIYVATNDTEYEGTTIHKGIYFFNEEGMYVSSWTYGSETVVQIDSKYIPTTPKFEVTLTVSHSTTSDTVTSSHTPKQIYEAYAAGKEIIAKTAASGSEGSMVIYYKVEEIYGIPSSNVYFVQFTSSYLGTELEPYNAVYYGLTKTDGTTTWSTYRFPTDVQVNNVSKIGSYGRVNLTADTAATSGSSNLITSGAVYTGLSNKQATISDVTNVGNVSAADDNGIVTLKNLSQTSGRIGVNATNSATVYNNNKVDTLLSVKASTTYVDEQVATKSKVEANPETTTTTIKTIKIDDVAYKIAGLPDGGTTGQVLVKTADGYGWGDVAVVTEELVAKKVKEYMEEHYEDGNTTEF